LSAAGGLDLVAGGAGFIGSHVVEALLAAGRRVRVADDLSSGHARNLEGRKVEFLKGDLAESSVAREACAGVERVFHLAARPSVPWSVAHPEAARRANLETTLALLEAAGPAGVERIVYSSSCAVYGDLPGLPKREDAPVAPLSPYAEHKLAGEEALAAAAAGGGPGAASLRYFNVYGPRQDPSSPYSGVVSLFTQRALRGERAVIFGDGEQTRDFVFVSDVVRANFLAAAAPLKDAARVFNVARGESVTILALWAAVQEAAGRAPREAEFAPARAGDLLHSRAAVERAAAELGFRAGTTLAEGLTAYLATGN